MKRYLYLLVLITIVVVFGLSGCKKETDYSPRGWYGTKKTASVVPKEGVYHTVVKGETISLIAEQYDISAKDLADANDLGLTGMNSIIYPGQELLIPKD